MSLGTPVKIRTLRRKLYCKAKAQPAFRFYGLYDKVCRDDILRHAYGLARANAGAPGVDGMSFEQIEAKGQEAWLAGLREALVSKTYRPDPVRRVTIPKPDGGERALGIPTIRDRVVQTAAKLVLEPIFEADFEDNAYGYRPARGAVDAVKEVHRLICRGYIDVVDADLSRYFDTIPHRELLQSAARRVADGSVLRLIKLWLKAPIEERDADGTRRMNGGKGSSRGTPQGGVASPLLANIYMNRFPKHWRLTGRGEAFQAHVVSYADDFVILSRGRAAEALTWDEGRDDKAWAEHQRGQDLAEGCPPGALRLPRLLVRASLLLGERPTVSGREPVQEERATAQDEGRPPADARPHRTMGRSARYAEQVSARLVELLRLWDMSAGLPWDGPIRHRARARLPRQTA
jgi:retron-type reverse transcriptase